MKNFIVYNSQGKILRSGTCQDSTFYLQANESEFVKEGTANDITQKIINVGVNGKIIDKTPEEIEAEKPPQPKSLPHEKQTAHITNEQWQDVLARLNKLETKV